ncbi:MAG TPA: 23S rRNA (uracil(1939)-C(5))-methyltransferase RlmD [Planctomycetota bacterium]|nr:23S rRNA (uracil(1939)-C(5))-methyltransferase RlmD [Planctomycetota bacterium]
MGDTNVGTGLGRKPRRGDRIVVDVLGYAAGGGLRGRYEDATGVYAVELRRGVPSSRIEVDVLWRRGNDLRARVGDVLVAGPAAVAPRCGHFPDCGGCAHQDLGYAAQLAEKRQVVERVLGAALVLDVPVEVPIGCEQPWRYRNKMDFTFGARRWIAADEPAGLADDERDFALGLHPAHQFAKVLDVRACEIVFAGAEAILDTARGLARELELSAWDTRSQSGLLRHLVLRRSWATGEVLVNLVTSEEAAEALAPWFAGLLARHPEVATLVQTVNTALSKTALGERELLHHGPGHISERLGGFEFRLSARSFFQTNTPQAERLLAVVLEEAAPTGAEHVLDLYCGVGSLTLPLARSAAQVTGYELVEEAVADARATAARNGVTNVEFVAGDVARTLGAAARPDVVVVDPPRGGLHPDVTAGLAAAAPKRLVSVSCNVQSAARDVAQLVAAGLRLVRVRPVDLFPHTPHCECVLTLERPA